MKHSILIAAAATAFAAASAPAAAARWEPIGSSVFLDQNGNRESILIGGEGPFDRVKLCVYRNALRISDVEITFRGGGSQTFSIRKRIKPGGCTRIMELEGTMEDASIMMMSITFESIKIHYDVMVKAFAQ